MKLYSTTPCLPPTKTPTQQPSMGKEFVCTGIYLQGLKEYFSQLHCSEIIVIQISVFYPDIIPSATSKASVGFQSERTLRLYITGYIFLKLKYIIT